LREERDAAQRRFDDLMIKADGLEFYSARELCDARAALELADSKFRLACMRYDAHHAGRKPKAQRITNGYITTGYKKIDGIRMPILEKVL